MNLTLMCPVRAGTFVQFIVAVVVGEAAWNFISATVTDFVSGRECLWIWWLGHCVHCPLFMCATALTADCACLCEYLHAVHLHAGHSLDENCYWGGEALTV